MDTERIIKDLMIIKRALMGMTFSVNDVNGFATVRGVIEFIDRTAEDYSKSEVTDDGGNAEHS